MEQFNYVKVDDVKRVLENQILFFIDEEIDESLESFCSQFDFDEISSNEFFEEDYNKTIMNEILSTFSKKKLKKISKIGSYLYEIIIDMEIKIHKNAFYFVAYLNNLNKTLNNKKIK